MTREQLEHVIRAAAANADVERIAVVGSQSLLGSLPDWQQEKNLRIPSLMNILREWLDNATIGRLAPRPDQLAKWMARRINPECMRVLVAAAPKSGSTYLTNILAKILNLKIRDVCALFGQFEQQIYLPRLLCYWISLQRMTSPTL